MKKILAAALAAALIACPFTSAFAKGTDAAPSGRTGGVIIEQGASSENYLAESAGKAPELPAA